MSLQFILPYLIGMYWSKDDSGWTTLPHDFTIPPVSSRFLGHLCVAEIKTDSKEFLIRKNNRTYFPMELQKMDWFSKFPLQKHVH